MQAKHKQEGEIEEPKVLGWESEEKERQEGQKTSARLATLHWRKGTRIKKKESVREKLALWQIMLQGAEHLLYAQTTLALLSSKLMN